MMKIIKGTNWYFVGLVIIILIAFTVVMVLSSYHPSHTKRLRDTASITSLSRIQNLLDDYYFENNSYPTSFSPLIEVRLKKLKENQDLLLNEEQILELAESIFRDPLTGKYYLYAFYPSENPTAYHLGAILELTDKDAVIIGGASLENDSDFDSKVVGYVNGFDGKDPMYDLHVSK